MAVVNRYIPLRISLLAAVLAAAVLAGPLAGVAGATSLWTNQGNLFADRKARAVGDVLTIVISENSTASRVDSASNSKASDVNVQAGSGLFSFIGGAGAETKDNFKAQGSIVNSNSVKGRVTVQVTAVKPNGNLVISGTQSIKQNGDEQKITITGEVRPEDVSADNTVLSSYVANAQLRIEGKGPISGKQRQGILSQLFNFLF